MSSSLLGDYGLKFSIEKKFAYLQKKSCHHSSPITVVSVFILVHSTGEQYIQRDDIMP